MTIGNTCENLIEDYYLIVSLKEIKSGVTDLPVEQQDQLAAYLVHLRHQRDAGLRREISSRLDDKNPNNWISFDQLKEHWKD